MKEYIDKLNHIKHFDINKFDDEIKYIMNKIFDEYYYNQNENIYYLIRQFSNIYYRMRKTDEAVKMIIRLNMYSNRKHI